jgi:hypothetical protein
MTREEQLEFCSVCQNKTFSPKAGIICKLTMELADFDYKCDNYLADEKEVEIVEQKKESIKNDVNKSINKGRISLFVLSGLYILAGFLEGFYIEYYNIIFGIIDWGIATCFMGLAIWSFSKPYFAILSGLIIYVLLVILLALIEPATIFSGIIWKIIIISYLAYATKTAKEENDKNNNFLNG